MKSNLHLTGQHFSLYSQKKYKVTDILKLGPGKYFGFFGLIQLISSCIAAFSQMMMSF